MKTTTIWRDGATMDLQKNLGADFLFGGKHAEELRWGHLLCEIFANTP